MAAETDFRKIYFHRPLWTPDNIRLWGILLVVGFLSVSIVFPVGRFITGIAGERITHNIKREYVAFLMQSDFQKGESIIARTETPPARPPETRPAGSAAVKAAGPTGGSGESSAGGGTGDAEGMNVIASAVESVAGYPAINYLPSRQERPFNYQSSVEIFRSHNNQIQIPIPETIRFASQNGNRDVEETAAVMEMNEIDIKYCFERIWRHDPSFSGFLLIRFTIHPDGYVIPESIKIINSNIPDPRVLDCIRHSIRRWRNFTAIAYDDGNFTITRKYVF